MKTKRFTSIVLCVALLLSFAQLTGFAQEGTAQWDSYFEEYSASGYGRPLLSPGSDDSQRNFSWYSPKGSKECKVLISESEDMASASTFSGDTVRTPEGDCVNHVTVTGLEDGTTYYYKCVTSKSESATASFDTIDGSDFTAMYVTDIHVTYDEDKYEKPLCSCAGVVNNVLTAASSKSDLDLVISAGDQGSYGLRSEYMSLLASPVWSGVPFALCAGNHDRKGFDYKYLNNNPNKYTKGISSYIAEDYWYVKGDVLFMVFDSNCFAAKTHRDFARDAVAKNPDVKWRVATFHHDMYGVMSDKRLAYSEECLRPIFGEICDEFGIDLVFTGHTHHYSMSNAVYDRKTTDSIVGKTSITDPKGTIYLVSGSLNHPRGGDGAPGDITDENAGYVFLSNEVIYNLVDFSEDSIVVKSYILGEDEPFRTFTINKTSQQGGHPEYTEKSGRALSDFKLQFKAFFEELGITIKVLFKKSEILGKQK